MQGQTKKDTEDDKVDTSTSFPDEEIDDPWNLNMFDNMNLDQVININKLCFIIKETSKSTADKNKNLHACRLLMIQVQSKTMG
jgi:hypothetical protein